MRLQERIDKGKLKAMQACRVLILATLVFAACERRPLEDRELYMAEVYVELDWSRSALNPAEATVIFYDENGNSPRTFYLLGNRGTVKLPVGKYSVIAFNDKMGDFSEFAFRGASHYKTLEVYATGMSKPSYFFRNIGQIGGETPDLLASDSREVFEVTEAMLEQTRANRAQARSNDWTRSEAHLVMFPLNVVAWTKVTAHVENMHLIRTGSQRAIIKGLAESVLLWNRRTMDAFMTHTIPFSNAQYLEGSTTNGVMSEEFTSFGLCTCAEGRQAISFLFEAVLRDKEQTRFSYQKDITDMVEIKKVEVGMELNIDIGVDPEDNNPPIPIPPITPEDDGAFRPGVGDWLEEEIIKPL